MQNNLVITIGYEYASGGREVADIVAQKLGIKVYDKELIAMIAKNSGMNEDILREIDEASANSFLYAVSSGTLTGAHILGGNLPITDKAFITCSNIIKELAEKESCVIVGRCSNYVLKGRENLLTVFVHEELESRAAKLSKEQKISVSEAENLIKKTDKKRANYHNYHADTRWGSKSAYDLCINSKIGVSNVADIIVNAANLLK